MRLPRRWLLMAVALFFLTLVFPHLPPSQQAGGLRAEQAPAQPVNVVISPEARETLVTVAAETDIQRFETLKLEAPPRLIADLWGLPTLGEARVFPSGVQFIKEVRLAPFRDRARLVIDFATREVPPYTVKSRPKGLDIVIENPPTVVAERPAPPRLEREPAGEGPAIPPGYVGARVTFDFQEVDIRTVFELLSEVSRLNIVADQEVKGKITLRMVNVPWDYVLDVILKANALDKEQVGNIIRIGLGKKIIAEREAEAKEQEAEELKKKEADRRDRAETRLEQAAAKKAALELEEFVVRNVPINYTDPAELAAQLEKLKSEKPGASVTPSVKTKSILIQDIKKNVEEMVKLVARMDIPTPQVMIEARIVQTSADLTTDLGIQWGGRVSTRKGHFSMGGGLGVQTFGADVLGPGPADPTRAPGFNLPLIPPGASNPAITGQNLAVNFPAAVGPGAGGAFGITIGRISDVLQLDIRLSALEADNKARVLSAPKVLTLDNKKAVIRKGATIPYVIATTSGPITTFEDADLSLTVTPHITPDKSVFIKLELTNDRPGAPTTFGPIIEQNRATTELLLNDGETIVVGGIISTTEDETLTGVPGLSRIPILGWLFKNKLNINTNTELLVFLTPRIITSER